jgi:subtilisin family serine protease
VAGIAAAIDNDTGVVGIAPGARIWAVKVLDESGGGSFSDVICGLDWVAANQATIDVVNLSLSGSGSDGPCVSSALHSAICNVVNGGVPVVVAAGNQGTDVSTRVPASFEEVITVGAFADSDGAPGKLGPFACFGADDTYLGFSNFGPDVDIAAPGDCILSLDSGGGTRRQSGTSEASPHVAGALAWYIASFAAANGGARPTPAQSRDWLLNEASQAQDGIPYPVLWLADAVGAP